MRGSIIIVRDKATKNPLANLISEKTHKAAVFSIPTESLQLGFAGSIQSNPLAYLAKLKALRFGGDLSAASRHPAGLCRYGGRETEQGSVSLGRILQELISLESM